MYIIIAHVVVEHRLYCTPNDYSSIANTQFCFVFTILIRNKNYFVDVKLFSAISIILCELHDITVLLDFFENLRYFNIDLKNTELEAFVTFYAEIGDVE